MDRRDGMECFRYCKWWQKLTPITPFVCCCCRLCIVCVWANKTKPKMPTIKKFKPEIFSSIGKLFKLRSERAKKIGCCWMKEQACAREESDFWETKAREINDCRNLHLKQKNAKEKSNKMGNKLIYMMQWHHFGAAM